MCAAEIGCTSYVLHKKTNAWTAVESYCESCKFGLDSRRHLSSVDLMHVKIIEKLFNGGS